MVQKNDKSVLKQILSKPILRSQAGNIYYSRGEEYFKDGNVRNLEIDSYSASAVVAGTHNYKVSLSVANGILRSSCNCPLGCGRAAKSAGICACHSPEYEHGIRRTAKNVRQI